MNAVVIFDAGMHISAAAARLCGVAKDQGSAVGDFNGIRLSADRSSTAEQIVAAFDRESAARAEAYRKSPEGIAAEERRNAERQRLQGIHDDLMARLPILEWTHVPILDWLCAMQEPSDHIGVIVKRDTIVAEFAKHLYTPGMDCGADYQRGVKNSEFRYLVGQALDGLARGPSIHSILHKFVAEWKARWPEGAAR